ncbi:MAG: esterase-like activity of phytase family protein [Sphingomonas sp.]|uniref:esterase-like activity of phytase family protein n=1 Tax=Sphingomonas sp. TaxID=28214 RepID=UPI001B28983B|nr:esterase-like activity of phytase family protein [Sphingomonas sp.]MBO9622257.1 esterase-like activity of phytase family protein [Sphingomonas sp.]
MRFPLLLSTLALLPLSTSDEQVRLVLGHSAPMRATPVALSADPAVRGAGALVYLGGLRLASDDRAFGGFSAIQVDGDQFTLLSDAGNIVRFRMGANLRPHALAYGDLPGGPGSGWRKRDRDSESLARDPATGRLWVGFEHHNAIWRYDGGFTHAERRANPSQMSAWPIAGGPEAMVRLRSGAFLVISETARPKGKSNAREALRFAGDPTELGPAPLRFAYVPPAGYDPVDMAELPDGRLLVLNRDFKPAGLFTAKLVLADARRLRPGAVVQGREIATLAAPLLHDNFEGVAVTREGSDTIVWIVSDDNSQFWEASLLLKFRLELPPEPEKGN